MDVRLRELTDDDLDAVFDWMRDRDAVRMAAFTAPDPDDRQRFDAWASRNRADPGVLQQAIDAGGGFAGTIASFTIEGDREIFYWVDPARWGAGIASAALAAFLALESIRPLFARTAEGNIGSARVLRRAGFRAVDTDTDFAPGRGRRVVEVVHRLDRQPAADDLTVFLDPPDPPGVSPYLPGAQPSTDVRIVDPDPAWPARAEALIGRIRTALGGRVARLEHVGSTAVPGLPAKPVIDLDLAVADPHDEDAYVPALRAAGFEHVIREPWWYGHRLLRFPSPRANLHVFGPESPESARQRLFRDWLRTHDDDRDAYARAKVEAAAAANAAGEHVQQYNARKERALREIYTRAFRELGLG